MIEEIYSIFKCSSCGQNHIDLKVFNDANVLQASSWVICPNTHEKVFIFKIDCQKKIPGDIMERKADLLLSLTIGRIVHYVSYGTPGGEYLPEHRAAIVTAVENKETGLVSLCVLNPTGMFFNQHVPYSESPTGGSWHWIERV